MLRRLVHLAAYRLDQWRLAGKRSRGWPTVEHAHRELEPVCVACSGSERLNVHHVRPFHLYPELELDPGNLISLCMGPLECHLKLGHGGSFRAYVLEVRALAEQAAHQPAYRPLLDAKARMLRQTARMLIRLLRATRPPGSSAPRS